MTSSAAPSTSELRLQTRSRVAVESTETNLAWHRSNRFGGRVLPNRSLRAPCRGRSRRRSPTSVQSGLTPNTGRRRWAMCARPLTPSLTTLGGRSTARPSRWMPSRLSFRFVARSSCCGARSSNEPSRLTSCRLGGERAGGRSRRSSACSNQSTRTRRIALRRDSQARTRSSSSSRWRTTCALRSDRSSFSRSGCATGRAAR